MKNYYIPINGLVFLWYTNFAYGKFFWLDSKWYKYYLFYNRQSNTQSLRRVTLYDNVYIVVFTNDTSSFIYMNHFLDFLIDF